MIRTLVASAFAASLLAGAAPSAFAQSRNPLSNVFNCDRSGSQQTPGALIGGALGGLAGAGVAKNDALGGILGAVVGAAAGSYIGCNLGGQDRASLEDATLQALNEGRNTTWSNSRTGASARINIMADTTGYGSQSYAPSYGERLPANQLRFATQVTNARGFETVAPRQIALAQTFIRRSPSQAAQTNGYVSRGEELEVMAKVQGQPWLLVGRNGVGAGYIPQSSARPVAESVTSSESYGSTYAQPIPARSLRLQNNVGRGRAYETAPQSFTVRSNATLRASPSTSARSLGMLYRGDELEALARVQGTQWILVGRNGEGVGYVHDSLLTAQTPSYSPGYGALITDRAATPKPRATAASCSRRSPRRSRGCRPSACAPAARPRAPGRSRASDGDRRARHLAGPATRGQAARPARAVFAPAATDVAHPTSWRSLTEI